ncbi:hypothetical protein DMENIID0001_121650 [Sergentomyia squamirostris]
MTDSDGEGEDDEDDGSRRGGDKEGDGGGLDGGGLDGGGLDGGGLDGGELDGGGVDGGGVDGGGGDSGGVDGGGGDGGGVDGGGGDGGGVDGEGDGGGVGDDGSNDMEDNLNEVRKKLCIRFPKTWIIARAVAKLFGCERKLNTLDYSSLCTELKLAQNNKNIRRLRTTCWKKAFTHLVEEYVENPTQLCNAIVESSPVICEDGSGNSSVPPLRYTKWFSVDDFPDETLQMSQDVGATKWNPQALQREVRRVFRQQVTSGCVVLFDKLVKNLKFYKIIDLIKYSLKLMTTRGLDLRITCTTCIDYILYAGYTVNNQNGWSCVS